jgi:hypothetical protein
MAATAAMVERLRRMTNTSVDDVTWHYDVLAEYIERHPVLDERGEEPHTWNTATTPPTQTANTAWLGAYDLHAAASDVWAEKAAIVAQDFTFIADGGVYTRSQVYQQYMKMAAFHAARRAISTIESTPWPPPRLSLVSTWQGNLPEPEDL